ncbi:hypothetical protein LINPERHAP1_LOCUS29805 [Linum perenne]
MREPRYPLPRVIILFKSWWVAPSCTP